MEMYCKQKCMRRRFMMSIFSISAHVRKFSRVSLKKHLSFVAQNLNFDQFRPMFGRFPDISANIGQISNLAPKMEDNFSWIFEKVSEYESEPRKLKILNDRPDIFASYSKNGGPPF